MPGYLSAGGFRYDGEDPAALKAQLTAVETAMQSVPRYVSGTRLHVAEVLANFPASAVRRGMLATVDDLFGALDGTLRCGFDGTNYFWQPSGLVEYFTGNSTPVTSDMVLTALTSPTIINLAGTVPTLTNRKVTLDPTNIWPGARKRINTGGITSLLGTIQLLNGVTSILNMALNTTYDVAADFSGGTPKWVRI